MKKTLINQSYITYRTRLHEYGKRVIDLEKAEQAGDFLLKLLNKHKHDTDSLAFNQEIAEKYKNRVPYLHNFVLLKRPNQPKTIIYFIEKNGLYVAMPKNFNKDMILVNTSFSELINFIFSVLKVDQVKIEKIKTIQKPDLQSIKNILYNGGVVSYPFIDQRSNHYVFYPAIKIEDNRINTFFDYFPISEIDLAIQKYLDFVFSENNILYHETHSQS